MRHDTMRTSSTKIFAHLAVLLLAVLLAPLTALPALAAEVNLLVEMENAVPAGPQEEAHAHDWTAQQLEGASGEKVLQASGRSRRDSSAVTVNLATPGQYRLWVRYHRPRAVSPGFFMLVRDNAGQVIAFRYLDFASVMPSETPYTPFASWAGEQTGFIWEPFDVTITHPMSIHLSMGTVRTGTPRDKGIIDRQVDCVLLTTDTKLDPAKLDLKTLAGFTAKESEPLVIAPAPKGWVWASGLPAHVDPYAGLPAHGHGKDHASDAPTRLEAGMINNGHQFTDNATAIRFGFNHDHAYVTDDSASRGIVSHGVIESYRKYSRQLPKQYPSPQGRFLNAQGKAGSSFSFHFEPAVASSREMLSERLKFSGSPQL